jgi:hypothetical protein
MKKLLLFLVISLGFIGSVNADTIYSCELSGIYAHPAKFKSMYVKTSGNKMKFTIEDTDGFKQILITEGSTLWAGEYFIIQDYINDNNFNATAQDQTHSFTNLAYEDGYITLSWMNRDEGSMGALFSKCSTSS